MPDADTPTRAERDTFGPIDVPAHRLWGAQTQRSLQNFDISGERQPRETHHGDNQNQGRDAKKAFYSLKEAI